jgi:chromosome segregation ATPase
MTLRDLKDELATLRLHEMTPVNAEGLSVKAGAVVIAFEESATESELAEVKADLESAREDYGEADKRADALQEELDKANALLDAVKDDGGTLRKYADRAEQAELICAGWKKRHDDMDRELTALRKRKGMLAALYANQPAVIGLLRDAGAGRPIDAAEALKLCRKIAEEAT